VRSRQRQRSSWWSGICCSGTQSLLILLLLRRYRLYKRVKAAVALPVGPERVAALHAAKSGDDKKH
jgi:hypothetical protein